MNETRQNHQTGSLFSFLYRTRVKVSKDSVSILNLSLTFMLLSLLFAPWLVIIGGIVALVMGYRFNIARNDPSFTDSFDNMVQQAAGNVKSAVNSFTQKGPTEGGEQ